MGQGTRDEAVDARQMPEHERMQADALADRCEERSCDGVHKHGVRRSPHPDVRAMRGVPTKP